MKESVIKTQVPAEEELVDVLLDFIVVSASLAKKVSKAIRLREEGVNICSEKHRCYQREHRCQFHNEHQLK